MAFNPRGLWRITQGFAEAGGRAATSYEFGYRTADAAASVEGANYFDDAWPKLRKGDTIKAVMATGTTPVLKQYVVTAASDSGITIALQTATAG